MEIRGVFGRFINRNEKTGVSRFTVKAEGYDNIICSGTVQSYPKRVPVIAECNKTDHEYEVVKIKACGYDTQVMYDFLCSEYFTGIQEATAEKILAFTGTADLFTYFSPLNNKEPLNIKGVPASVTDSMVSRITRITEFERFNSYIYENGGEYYNTAKIFDKYGMESLKRVMDNPYILLYAGAEPTLCERMAEKNGIKEYDKRRIKALVEYAVNTERSRGNTKTDFCELVHLIEYIEKISDSAFKTNPLFIAEEVMSDKYVLETSEASGRINVYSKDDYDNERNIVEDFKRISLSAAELKNTVSVEEIEKKCGVIYSDEQVRAFNVLKSSGIKIITGGPGTGKTTLLNGILQKYELDNPQKEILLCAPTGQAAKRMRESTGREAFTVHKALGLRPFETGKTDVDVKKLDADCIVADECSMLDAEIFSKLLYAVKNGALLILLGDKDQLPSIGAGNVLEDLLQSGRVEYYELTKIFRQNNNLIIENSRRVSEGDKNIITGDKFIVKRFLSEDDMVGYATGLERKCKNMAVRDVRFFTPSRNRKFKSGTISMNRILQKVMDRTGQNATYGYYTYYIGDNVVFNANNYEKGYYNGQEGIVSDIQEHNNSLYVTVQTDEGFVNLTGTEIENIELGYIMTAHKSQGSECRNAVILIPLKPASLLKRKLLYVEITRAKECVMILSEKDALEQAISGKYEYIRHTGLKEKLIAM